MHTFYWFPNKELTYVYFPFPCILIDPFISSVYWQFHCGYSFWQWHYSVIILSFCIYTNFTFLWVAKINFLLGPACWSPRNCTICQQFLLFWFEFLRSLFSVLGSKNPAPVTSDEVRTTCQSGPVIRACGGLGSSSIDFLSAGVVYRVHPHTLSHPTPGLKEVCLRRNELGTAWFWKANRSCLECVHPVHSWLTFWWMINVAVKSCSRPL